MLRRLFNIHIQTYQLEYMSHTNHFDGIVQCEYFNNLFFVVNFNHVLFRDEFLNVASLTKMSLANVFNLILPEYIEGIS